MKKIKNLNIKNLVVQFDDLTVLDNINLTINQGEFICILGSSGCGKTTLLNVMAGFINPTSGQVCYENRIIKKPTSEICTIYQEHALFPWMTIYENIESGLKFSKVNISKRKSIIKKFLHDFDLKGYGEYYPHEISHGMRQRVAICRSLAVNPAMILMDEPFSSLDPVTKLKLQKYILNVWKKTNKTIVFVTHDIDEAIFLSDKIFVLTKKPSTIKKEIINPLQRPRRDSVIISGEYIKFKQFLLKLINKINSDE